MNTSHALIIEDNIKNVRILGILLDRFGVGHTDILNPVDILEMLPVMDMDSINIVFLDLEMPDVNGYDVLDMLKSDVRFSEVPIVAYTAHSSEASNARNAGFHSFIAKPLSPDRFPDQLARILRGEHVWDRV